jgi:hypothetical protein
MAKENMLQRALRRFASSNAELESEDLQRRSVKRSAVPIQNCEDRQRVQLTGTVSTVTITPRAGHPALEVSCVTARGCDPGLAGRRQILESIPVEPSKSGAGSAATRKRLIYNPRYELMEAPAA